MINLSSINLAGAGGTGGGGGSHTATFPDVTIYGQPTINGAQIGNFSAQNYLQLPFVVDFAGRPWQIDFAFTTGTDVQTQQNILDSRFGLAFAIAQGKLEIALSSNGTSWNLGAHFGTLAITPETSYKVRMTFDGTQYEVKVSTNGSDYVSDIVVTSTESLAPKQMLIGVSPDGSHAFGGSVNLAHATLIISGKPVWQGMTEVGNATRMALDMSNIDAEGKQRLNDIAMQGAVGQELEVISDAMYDVAFGSIFSDEELPTLCGQPAVLFGAGTPQEAVVPDNWKQYDADADEGYNWNGQPSAIGQRYIDTDASSRAEYIAVRSSYDKSSADYDVLKWLNL